MTLPATTRRAKTRSAPRHVEPAGKPFGYELIGIGLIVLGVMLLLPMFTTWDGRMPYALRTGLCWFVGTYGAWGIAVAMMLLGIALLVHLAEVRLSLTSLGMGLIYLAALTLLQLQQTPVWNPRHFATEPGGAIGGLLAGGLHALLGDLAWLVPLGGAVCGISLMTDVPLWMLVAWPFKLLFLGIRAIGRALGSGFNARRAARRAAHVAALQEAERARRFRPEPEETPAPRPFPPMPEPTPSPAPLVPEIRDYAPEMPALPEDETPPKPRTRSAKARPEQLELGDLAPQGETRPYVLPPTDLLTFSPKSARQGKDDTQEKIAALEATLSSFGIDAKVVGVERGPRVTRFEMIPPPGIRISRITNLADNIALSLAALDVRVEAPVPGKGVIGIEVPNKESVIVDLRELMESDPFLKAKTPITFALGRDIAGHPRVADLARMPHLLIAGATNSGKSVCINSLICSILMRATPREVKFLMVDPKRVELSLFQSIPHLCAPVAYDAKHAAGLLRWAIREMEQRYEMFAEKGVRNIIGFNEQSRLEGLEELPYIVIIIDELADLMMQAAAEFEASICRIAQLARATGIHLVVATQRPSVNVITGTIKANIPSRIAFAVASQVDSRTILDMNGAERLVGQGDMLFLPVEASKPVRIQGAYVSEKDINRIVEHVKAQGKPHFTDEIVAIEEEALHADGDGGGFSDEPEDELFEKALDFLRTTQYASTSMLQRKFRIGYTRAARLMDLFEERGYVGPGQGSKPREVIFAPSSSVTGMAGDRRGSFDEADEDDEDL